MLSLTALLTTLSACNSGSLPQDGGTGVAAFAVAPAAPQVAPGDRLQFAVTPIDVGQAVAWAVAEPNGGTIDAAGHYTAPDIEGEFTIIAASAAEKRSTSVHVTRNPSAATSGTTPTVSTTASTPAVTMGAGTTHQPTYLKGVTGGGSMPSTAGAPTASCAGDGTTDDTACLQNAINSAAAAGQPLLIPATSSYYKISAALNVTTSLIGTGGMPTIKTIDTEQYQNASVLHLVDGFSGWVYNLHAVGTWDGTVNPGTEYNHGINVGCVNGVTIMGNLLEKVRGDGISTDGCQQSGGSSQNVLVANNTTKDTWRCGIAFTTTSTNWVIRDNLIDKQVNYVSGIDFEPWKTPLTVNSVEVLYNKFNMNNRSALSSPYSGSASGSAVFGWAAVPSPGGTYWVHHNYGTFGTGFGSFDGGFTNVTVASNAEGSSPAN